MNGHPSTPPPAAQDALWAGAAAEIKQVSKHLSKLSIEAVKHAITVNSGAVVAVLGLSVTLKVVSVPVVFSLAAFLLGVVAGALSWGLTYRSAILYMRRVHEECRRCVAGEISPKDAERLINARGPIDWGEVSAWLSYLFFLTGGVAASVAVLAQSAR